MCTLWQGDCQRNFVPCAGWVRKLRAAIFVLPFDDLTDICMPVNGPKELQCAAVQRFGCDRREAD